MPRRSILSAAERDSLLALPDTQDELALLQIVGGDKLIIPFC